MECRICNSTMKKFLDLGMQPIANNFLVVGDILDEFFYHLELFFCPECYSVQVGNCPEKEKIYHKGYTFYTSTSNYMARHFKELADDIKASVLEKDGFIVEIGSNDGTFLKNFRGYKHLGVEPSESVDSMARKKGLRTWNDFFCEELAERIVEQKGQADVIVTTNAFPHMIDRISVLKGIKKLLSDTGVWVNEEAYLGDVVSLRSYDQFYNEHIYFSSVSSFKKNMDLFGMFLYDALPMDVHGGSMRYLVSKVPPVAKSVRAFENNEKLRDFEHFEKFGEAIKESRKNFLHKVFDAVGNGGVVGYAATAKSTTVLNYCKVGPRLVDRIYDTTPAKQWKLSPGMHIPVVPYDSFKKDKPKNVVLFAWNHYREIMEKEKDMDINWIIPI